MSDEFERAYATATAAAQTHGDAEAPAVVAGDLNSNTVYDKQTRGGHTKLVAHLESIGLVSAYHHRYPQKSLAAELRGTYFQHTGPSPSALNLLDYTFRPHD